MARYLLVLQPSASQPHALNWCTPEKPCWPCSNPKPRFLQSLNLALSTSLIVCMYARGSLFFFFWDQTCQKGLVLCGHPWMLVTHGGCSDVMLKLTSSARHDHRLCCTLTKAELLVQLEKSYILTARAQWNGAPGAFRPLSSFWLWNHWLPKACYKHGYILCLFSNSRLKKIYIYKNLTVKSSTVDIQCSFTAWLSSAHGFMLFLDEQQ